VCGRWGKREGKGRNKRIVPRGGAFGGGKNGHKVSRTPVNKTTWERKNKGISKHWVGVGKIKGD